MTNVRQMEVEKFASEMAYSYSTFLNNKKLKAVQWLDEWINKWRMLPRCVTNKLAGLDPLVREITPEEQKVGALMLLINMDTTLDKL